MIFMCSDTDVTWQRRTILHFNRHMYLLSERRIVVM